ncbi:methyl-accepting chemotaxis protein [Cytobacillus sp. IB215316]|uniref:methyl-accepting chemotaxis protein n=2 Tax=Bacillaceae TaxID=186817 RepID=UPI002A166E99|nr:methyl-accepting chemotaxis protein [Cytobacillus sp. IB215316]MDX8359167.1 methyl-accepting chemotaxis protein [Cytobacillus sp. IB215316]
MFTSIKRKLLVLFMLLMIGTLLFVALFLQYQTEQQIEKDVKIQAENLVEQINNYVDSFVEKYAISIEEISREKDFEAYVLAMLSANESDIKELDPIILDRFNNYLDLYSDAYLIYVAARNDTLKIQPPVELGENFTVFDRPWYTLAEQTKDKAIWTEPYISEDGELVVTVSKAMIIDNEFKGVIAADLKLEQLESVMQNIDLTNNGYPFILDKNKNAIVHPTERGNNLSNLEFIGKMYGENEQGFFHYNFNGEEKVLAFETVDQTGWKLGTSYTYKDLMASSNKLRSWIMIISLTAVVLSLIIVYVVTSRILNPIIHLKKDVMKVAAGDLTVKTKQKTRDEIGDLTIHFNDMVKNMRHLILAIEQSNNHVFESVQGLSAVSEETNASSEEIAKAINEIALGASRSAEDIEKSNQLISVLSTQIKNVTTLTDKMSLLSVDAEKANENGFEKIEELKSIFSKTEENFNTVDEIIVHLEKKIAEIESVMKTINDFSEQTNLLSLNASIEAARAGEHGKGFAVVANEVRKLAEQSTVATDQVRRTIQSIQSESKRTVHEMANTKRYYKEQALVVNDTEQAFNTISTIVDQLKSSIDDVQEDMTNIHNHRQEVSQSIENIAAMSQQAVAACEEVSASTDEQSIAFNSVTKVSEDLLESSEELTERISRFKV